jgi:hypothetical protein
MFPNAKGSELLSILATIDPAAQAAGTITTGWISVANHHGFLSLVQTGVLGTSATVDAKLQQALDSSAPVPRTSPAKRSPRSSKPLATTSRR